MVWKWGALMPHPPIIVPEVGRGRERTASATLEGMNKLVKTLTNPHTKPDFILLLSPHQPYVPGALFVNNSSDIQGSLAGFGAPSVTFSLPAPTEAIAALSEYLKQAGIPVAAGAVADLSKDHGATVPLYFLSRCWDSLPPVILANPVGLSVEQSYQLGKMLTFFKDGHSWGLLASGDLSHCLKPGAPAGYAKEGKAFDDTVVRALQKGEPELAMEFSNHLINAAKECGLRSVLALLGLCDGPLEVFSYEGPFGVGYCTALSLFTPTKWAMAPERTAADVSPEEGSLYPALARIALERYLSGDKDIYFRMLDTKKMLGGSDSLWGAIKACFVTLKHQESGKLRGCIGTVMPMHDSLRMEIITNAISAATRDPRFPPVQVSELADLEISVDVLSTPERVPNISVLDPKIYGVIVTKNGRRGLLLPDLDGVDTVEEQLSIAARKGGIENLEGAKVQAFTVHRYLEARK